MFKYARSDINVINWVKGIDKQVIMELKINGFSSLDYRFIKVSIIMGEIRREFSTMIS